VNPERTVSEWLKLHTKVKIHNNLTHLSGDNFRNE
jgi:hypothetical protein